jgi:hypothetical protein
MILRKSFFYILIFTAVASLLTYQIVHKAYAIAYDDSAYDF